VIAARDDLLTREPKRAGLSSKLALQTSTMNAQNLGGLRDIPAELIKHAVYVLGLDFSQRGKRGFIGTRGRVGIKRSEDLTNGRWLRDVMNRSTPNRLKRGRDATETSQHHDLHRWIEFADSAHQT